VFSVAPQGDKALAAEYFGHLDSWWSGQIVLHALELVVGTYADLQVLMRVTLKSSNGVASARCASMPLPMMAVLLKACIAAQSEFHS